MSGRSATAEKKKVANGHLAYLDGLRGLLALYVVQRHVEVEIWQVGERDRQGTLSLMYLFRCAHFAVDIFIVISGFCLFLPVLRNQLELRGGVATFLKRRAFRILPPYYATVALSMLALYIVGDTQQFTGKNSPTIWHHLLLVHDAFSPNLINAALWSIAVEVHIYLLFPLVVWSWRTWGAARTFAWAAPLSIAAYLAVTHTGYGLTTPYYLVLFMFGMTAALVHTSPRWAAVRGRIPWAALGAALILIGFVLRNRRVPALPIDLLVGVGGACLLVAGSLGGPLSRLLGWRPLAFVGRFSYSLYLVHIPMLLLLERALISHEIAGARGVWRLPVLLLLVLLLTGAAYLFHLLIERPFLGGAPAPPTKAPVASEGAESAG